MLIRIVVCCSLLFGVVSTASAQTEKRFGFVIGYPAVAGVQWQVSDRFAIRGDAGFDWGVVDTVTANLTFGSNFGNNSNVSTSTTRFRHSTTAVGVSGLVTVSRREQLRLYLAPRISWNRLHSSVSSDAVTISLPGAITSTLSQDRSSSSTTNGVGADGMFGANYRLGDRFEVFGEAGVSFRSPTSTSTSTSAEVTSYSVGSRGDVGIVVRF